MSKNVTVHSPKWRDATNDYPDIKRAFFVAEQVTRCGQEKFQEMMINMWNMEFPTEEEIMQSRLMVIDLIGWEEMSKCLTVANIEIPESFETYYKFMT